ncbi:hypothetical protein [Fibrella arboris]|uniref:hypothetical protein n=1 Tax=Fibrella arboris TaxID=3242486 RepID=UPI003520A717
MALFRYESLANASILALLIVGGLFVPLAVSMYRNQVKVKGVHTNFDVSDQRQRQTWYYLVISLLGGVTFILYVTNQSYILRIGFLLATLLLVTSQLVNLFIKSSLHVSLNTYLAFLLLLLDVKLGVLLLAFIPMIGWSRRQLNRHTVVELLTGGVIGSTFGSLLYYLAQ